MFLLPLAIGLFAAERPYDPKANPAEDLKRAVAEAGKTKKNILLDVGGAWCGWCRRLDQVFDTNGELSELRDKNFVFLKVNFSPENENQAFLSQFPKIQSYPHLIVLDATGRHLTSQDTGVLEEGKGYSLQRITAFLEEWAPKGKN
ncbi:thioredoxin family protein [uncultured Paludibaculum sp.]|uniref:thioredoxin family protein n=1 Tax=uncultured Paludibaculum sp. TaxID=1765020 RepID=UPI002AAB4BB3|nr:thioredoxin family protein [uncultured Paludibaculum sp.]